MTSRGGDACASAPTTAEFKHPQQRPLIPCEARAQQQQGGASFSSSSVFCRGGVKQNTTNSSHSPGGSTATVATASDDRKQHPTTNLSGGGDSNKKADPVDLIDMQQRLRMTPSALWGERANLADEAEQQHHQAIAGEDGEGSAPTALTSLTAALHSPPQRGSDTLGETRPERNGDRAGRESPPPAVAAHKNGKSACHAVVGKKTMDAVGCGGRTSANNLAASALSKDDGGESEFSLPAGETLAHAASLKRPVVTSSVPLRWQSRVVTLSTLQNHGGSSGGAPRHGSSAASGKRRVRTKPRLNQRSTKKR